MTPRLFIDPVNWRLVLLAVAPTALIAWLVATAVRRTVKLLMHRLRRDTIVVSSPLIRAPLRLISWSVFALVFGVLIFPAFELVGLHPRTGVHLSTLSYWFFDSGLRVLLIAAVAYAATRLVAVGVKRFEDDVHFGTGLDALERAKRARTLGTVVTHMTTSLILIVATLMILREFSIDISPALTGAGIVGVALGFGAQSLVRDLIGGFFLILENQIRVGDIASINSINGLVEAINLRTTILRDEQGTVHVVPNGAINTLANRSKDFSYYVIDLPLAYSEDTDAVAAVLEDIAGELQEDDRYMPFILEPLEVLGVDSFEENGLRLKVRIKTAPQKQWVVGRELRRRILRAMRQRNIQMWAPQRPNAPMFVSSPPKPVPPPSGPGTPAQS
jgi:moderate conductance mechanosensitive channel